jgi:Tetratricopeptide repeat
MSSRASSAFFACLLLWIAACSRLPSPDEVAAPNEDVVELIRAHEDSMQSDGIEPHRAALEATLLEVERRYGTNSSAYVQAYAEAAVMVYGAAGAESSIEFFRDWLRVSESVYGHEHRETAFAISDFGRIKILTGGYDPAALTWLREALQVRRRVLGLDHKETAASEGFVAEELLASCDLSIPCRPDDIRLAEAERLAGHAYEVYRTEFSVGHRETGQMRQLLGRIRDRVGKSADRNAGGLSPKHADTPTR